MTEVAEEAFSEEHLLNVDVQNVLSDPAQGLSAEQLTLWANLAYTQVNALKTDEEQSDDTLDVTIRLVEKTEITQLNSDYRGKDKPTNVLSFPFENELSEFGIDMSDEWDVNLLGDVIICHDIVVEEASAQKKSIADHYAHMVVHGILHLCGYDHLDDTTAEEMEGLEALILAKKQIANPYL